MSGAENGPPPEADWPAPIEGVTETVVATYGPNDRWNMAALGLREAESAGTGGSDGTRPTVTARTWGRTRTRRNFEHRGEGVVQFITDPRHFVDAALTIREETDPVLDSADAWCRVEVERIETGTDGGTEWVDWRLRPVESVVRRRGVRTINRGFNAVIDATVAASRLDVNAYDTDRLLDRLDYFDSVVDACGGPAERDAFDRIDAAVGWRDRR